MKFDCCFITICFSQCQYDTKCNNSPYISINYPFKKASWIKKEFKDKTRDGRIIRTREEAVPATVYTYRIDRQCKHCGHEDYLIKEEKREN